MMSSMGITESFMSGAIRRRTFVLRRDSSQMPEKRVQYDWQRRVARFMVLVSLSVVLTGGKWSCAAFCDFAPKPPLIAAILADNIKEACKLLKSHPRQVFIREHLTGFTPLHYAVRTGSVKLVKMLLDVGASASVRDKRGRLPLHMAAVRGSFAIPKFPLPDKSSFPKIMASLVKAYREVDIKDLGGNTPLLLAAQCGSWDTVHFLIIHGAVVNETNSKGQTPLHAAVIHDHVRIVRLLMQSGAHAHIKDNDYRRPIDLAQGKEYLLTLLNASMSSE